MTRRPALPVGVLALLLALGAAPATAQTGEAAVSVVYRQVVADPALADTASLGQVAVPLSVLATVAPGVDVSLRAAYASTTRGGAAGVDGFTDAQVGLSVRRSVAGGQVAVAVTGVLPGGSELGRDEATTAFLAAQDFYGFAARPLRSGPSVAPSVSVAIPAGPALVVGGGVAYRMRAAFDPRAGLDASFDPGDEILVTAGFDALLANGSTVAVDGSYVRFGTDTLGELEYTTGDAFGGSVEWAGLVGRTALRVLAAARQKAESDVDPATRARLGLDTAVPTQGRVAVLARVPVGARLGVGVEVGGRYYAASEAFGSRSLVDLRLTPSVALGGGAALVGRIGGTVGSLTAVEAGVGVSISL